MKRIPGLEALGLTPLEALLYAYLVANPSTTGYKVSKGVGKPTANVYRALESLERKGAATRDRTSPPLFRAVPPEEFLDQLEREFHDRRNIAANALASLASAPERDRDGVFALGSTEQVMGRARVMLAAVRGVALVAADMAAFAVLGDAIDGARVRGTRVLVLTPSAPESSHPDTIAQPPEPDANPPGLRMACDAREALIAFLATDGDEARDALWTRNTLVARTLHHAIASEFFFALVARGLSEGLSVDEVEDAFDSCRRIRALARPRSVSG